MKNFFLAFAALVLLFNLGCSVENPNSVNLPHFSDYSRNQQSPQSSQECYLSGCISTVTFNPSNDPSNDYLYPNPLQFPKPDVRAQYRIPIAYLDLLTIAPSTKLSGDFTASEFFSEKKGRYALFSSEVITILQAMRQELNSPIDIFSGYRSPGYNSRTSGAAKWSRHTYGDGVDFAAPGISYKALKSLCDKHQASFTLIYSNHIHCDWRLLPLDSAFYPPNLEFDDLGNSSLSDHSLTDKFLIQQQYTQKIHLLVKPTQSQFIVSAELAFDEIEEGNPTYEWNINLPDKSNIQSNATTVTLPKLKGQYIINLTIGGSIEVSETIQW